jgi:hypothetical protein
MELGPHGSCDVRSSGDGDLLSRPSEVRAPLEDFPLKCLACTFRYLHGWFLISHVKTGKEATKKS